MDSETSQTCKMEFFLRKYLTAVNYIRKKTSSQDVQLNRVLNTPLLKAQELRQQINVASVVNHKHATAKCASVRQGD